MKPCVCKPKTASLTRERFLAVVLTAPLARADAIICLCGQDGEERASVAQQLLIQGCATHIVLTGGLDGKDKKSAKTLAATLMGKGVSPSRIIEDNESKNTKEQAENVTKMVTEKNWKQILLVASPEHLPRAFLTFVKASEGLDVRIVPVAANHVKWWGKPEGVTTTRLALLDGELAKCQAYQELGDVATYEEGLAHLKGLES